MGDEGEIWRAHKEYAREKKVHNKKESLALLRYHGYEVECLDQFVHHYRVNGWSFWPTTGKFYDPKTGRKGRGVFNLLKILKQNAAN